mmetsp:Transcript_24507/g.56898  ORF Transcript_24507/g.56898 Transcript_24507/m.56898 type:complete len:212 (-) Transcript_24507:149-784(-)
MISVIAVRHVWYNSGILGITSWVACGPVVAWTAVVEQMKVNFSQIFARASSSRWPSMPGAASSTAFTCKVRASGAPVNSPKVMYGGFAAQCLMCPGSAMAETMLQQPARAWPFPQPATISLMVDRPSTPFCKGKTSVFGPHHGSHIFKQPWASQALHPSMITSASQRSSLSRFCESRVGPREAAGICTSPQMLVIRTPCSFRAASVFVLTM